MYVYSKNDLYLCCLIFWTISYCVCNYLQEIFQHLPHQRKFDKSEKGKIEDLLKLKVNKKLLQQHISDATQKVVTLKDISNVQTGLRSTKDRNDISALVSKLEAMEGMYRILDVYFRCIECS